jgi:hypothetical protein
VAVPRGGARGPGSNQPRTPRIQIPEGVSEFYSNSLLVGFTAWDVTLLFGSTALPESISGETGAQQLLGNTTVDAVVKMSPQHAKAAARALNDVVAAYERQFGELHIPGVPDANT